ncbi:hypothetical protein POM88_036943 [Heracleum sosnowskyi]|uniref:RPW8 domain-containing protein n=1 Tax=Heracleum sosnowskyi TaxID=360622 RepID=A0AAD8HPG1_9APIA|nr:hypothetical protein POM88_036943 [Heracleum sosnowskyi]
MDLFLDAALGTALSELLRLVVTVEKRRGDFRGNLETLKNTLESAIFTLNELEKLNIILSRPEETTRQFINQLSQGVQGSVAVNTLRNGIGIQEINDKLDFMFKCLNIKYEYEIHVKKRHEALHSASCGAYLCGVSGSESVQGPPDEFEMLQVDAEIQTHSSDEFSSWVTVPSLPNSVVGLDKEPCEVISGPGSLQDPEIQSLDDQYAMSIACQSALPKDGSSRNPGDIVETPLYGVPEVVWKMEEASQIRKRFPGVVIRECSSEIIVRSPASKCQPTSTAGGKGKEKL